MKRIPFLVVLSSIGIGLVLGACSHAPVTTRPRPGLDLSLTAPPEYPDYLLISLDDLERLLNRAQDAESRLEVLWLEHGYGLP